MRTPEVAPGRSTGNRYAHAHIKQTKNAREHCTALNHACKEMSPFAINASTYTCGFRINANLVMEELIDLKVYKYIYMLTQITIMHYR